MSTGENAVALFLREKLLETNGAMGEGSFLNSNLFKMILRGDAKLPLDRVEEVADALGCDVRQLFRLAARQFYDQAAICLFVRMLGTPMTNEEQKWLHEIRLATDGPVSEPNSVAKRLVRALVQVGGAE